MVIKVLREDEALRSFLGEVNIWRQLRHPCVCSLLGVCLFEEMPAMVLEFLQGGSLHDLLHGGPGRPQLLLSTHQALRICCDIAAGLAFLHPRMVHR